MKILKHGKVNLACLISEHKYKMGDIQNRYIGDGMYEFAITCNKCGKKTIYKLSEQALGFPSRKQGGHPDMITTTDMLRWLDDRRSEVNARIVAAPPDEEGSYHSELKIINAICERVRRDAPPPECGRN